MRKHGGMVRIHEENMDNRQPSSLFVKNAVHRLNGNGSFFSKKEGFRYSRSHSKELLLMKKKSQERAIDDVALEQTNRERELGFVHISLPVQSLQVCCEAHSLIERKKATWIKETASSKSSSQKDSEQRYQIQGKSSIFSKKIFSLRPKPHKSKEYVVASGKTSGYGQNREREKWCGQS